MPAPWIEAWKAWLARVAERFVQADGPTPDDKARRISAPKGCKPAAHSLLAPRKNLPHRSGQRHG